ncbi:MAG: hypothetical protein P8H52_05715 [Porticoccaceae bacterium]|nr:hypothetical protein [Porticoccaceae bacterium]
MSLSLFFKHLIVTVCLSAVILSHAQDESADHLSILDVDGSGEVDALTDGLLLLRSMFGLTDDALISGTVTCTSDQCGDVAENIDARISKIKELKGDVLKAKYADTCHFNTSSQPYEILVVPKWNATEDEISQLQSRIKGVNEVSNPFFGSSCLAVWECQSAVCTTEIPPQCDPIPDWCP